MIRASIRRCLILSCMAMAIGVFGTAVHAQLVLSPSSIDFGTQAFQTSSAARTLTLRNAGSEPVSLHVSWDCAQGPGCGDFRLNASRCFFTTLAPGESCTVDMSFKPSGDGLRRAVFQAGPNGAAVPVAGTGVGALLTVVPERMVFGVETVGASSAPQMAIVTNRDTIDRQIYLYVAPKVSVGFEPGIPPGADDFSFTPSCTAPITAPIPAEYVVTLPPGGSCTLPIVFQPTGLGSRNGAVVVYAGGTLWSMGVSLSGVGDGPAQLGQISTRVPVLTGEDIAIAGFVIAGSKPKTKTIVLRVRGPSLAAAGIANPLGDPRLYLVRSADGAVIASNDDWESPNAAPSAVGALIPTHPRESLIYAGLEPGAYTAVVSGSPGGTGVALVEVFDVDPTEQPRLVNLSTRGYVGNAEDVMIAGFVLNGSRPASVVVRALGPSLERKGISRPLADPVLHLVRASDRAVLATNDNWRDEPDGSRLTSLGLAPSNDREAALHVTLEPGIYTAIVSGAGGATGTAIVEVFAVDSN
jgi:hypothetical protein